MKMQMVLTFNGGAQVRVDVGEEPTTKSNAMTGAIRELAWTTPSDWTTQLIDFDGSQLVCVHVERYHEPAAPDGDLPCDGPVPL